jgi:hypothetical protein
MASIHLLEHVRGTYTRLRRGMGIIALALPLLLWLGGALCFNVPLQPSISDYYHAGDHLRDILVGILFAMGAFLFLYKGETKWEDWLLNVAGVSALGIAYFETAQGGCATPSGGVSVHGTFALVFFLAITAVCVIAARRPAQAEGRSRDLAGHGAYYLLCAAVMVASLAVGIVYTFAMSGATKSYFCERSIIFWVEAFAVWAFAAYWLLRTVELDAAVSWLPWRKAPVDAR